MVKKVMASKYRPFWMTNAEREAWGDIRSQRLSAERPLAGNATWSPRVNVYWKRGKIYVDAEMPGVSEDDITVSVAEKSLTMSGKKSFRHEVDEDADFHVNELCFGPFYRVIDLPQEVNTGDVKTAFFNGMLSLVLTPRL